MEVLEELVHERTLVKLQEGPGILDEATPLPLLHPSRARGPVDDPTFYGEVFGLPEEYRWLTVHQHVEVHAWGSRRPAVITLVEIDLQYTGHYRFSWTAITR